MSETPRPASDPNAEVMGRLLQNPPTLLEEGGYGLRVLEVPGRRSGQLRRKPVGVTVYHGAYYLVSPNRTRDWPNNVLASGGVTLLAGGTRQAYRATLAPAAEAVPVLRLYLHNVARTAPLFPFAANESDEQITAKLDQVAVFRIDPKAE